MSRRNKNEDTDYLFHAILNLETIEDCYSFFDDICTVNELLSLSQRFSVARKLKMGKTYNDIKNETGASTATISRVNRSLNYGSDGYKKIIEKLNNSIGTTEVKND